VAAIVYAPAALAHLERAFEFLAAHDPDAARDAAEAIRTAIETLSRHPFVGRRLHGEVRELVISHGRTGYLALYRFLPARDEVRVLGIRHQRELGYRG
jgi:plasmid stabilization system protein ParE